MKPDPYKHAQAAREQKMERVVVTVSASALSEFDRIAADNGCVSRAEAIRNAINEYIERHGK